MKSLKLFSIFLILVSLIACHLSHPSSVLAASCYDDCLAKGNTPIECKAACGSWVDDLTPQKLEQEIKLGKLSKETSTVHTLNVLTTAGVRMIVGPIEEEASTQGTSYRPGGAIGGVTTLIAAMYANPPASGVEYLADLGRNLGIVSPAYAQQGVGFGGLKPIRDIWKAFRNIAYLFFIIIFIATGFAIMFRMKISPQAVMTIQSALPRVVIALILVTFSYAIAGFIIDLMYVVLTLGIAALGAAKLFSPAEVAALQEQFVNGGFGTVMGAIFKGLTSPLAWAGIGGLIGTALGFIINNVVGAVVGALAGGGIFLLIIGVTVLYVVVKLLFELLKTYISILMSIIFAPFQIMLGVLPGNSGFGGWMMGLLGNLMVFPAVAMALLIGRLLIKGGAIGTGLWAPPMVGAGGLSPTLLPGLIGLGFLLMLHKIPEMVKQAFGQKPMPYGTAIGEALGPVVGVGRYGVISGMETGYERGRRVGGPWAAGTPRERIVGTLKEVLQKQIAGR